MQRDLLKFDSWFLTLPTCPTLYSSVIVVMVNECVSLADESLSRKWASSLIAPPPSRTLIWYYCSISTALIVYFHFIANALTKVQIFETDYYQKYIIVCSTPCSIILLHIKLPLLITTLQAIDESSSLSPFLSSSGTLLHPVDLLCIRFITPEQTNWMDLEINLGKLSLFFFHRNRNAHSAIEYIVITLLYFWASDR